MNWNEINKKQKRMKITVFILCNKKKNEVVPQSPFKALKSYAISMFK